MPAKKHFLTNVDENTRSADCSFCGGRTRFRTHKGIIRCESVLRSEVPERRSRSHSLSNINEQEKTADCLQCGSVTIIYQGEKNSTKWRCEVRARLSDNYKGRYEHPKVRDRDEMLEVHGPSCDICGTEEPGGQGNKLHYDHNHLTGKHRGWLCMNCNQGIGKFKDDPKLLQAAMGYLLK